MISRRSGGRHSNRCHWRMYQAAGLRSKVIWEQLPCYCHRKLCGTRSSAVVSMHLCSNASRIREKRPAAGTRENFRASNEKRGVTTLPSEDLRTTGGKTCMTEIELQGDSPTPRKDEERTSGWDHEARTNPDKIIAPSSFACSSWGLYLFAWKDNGGKTAKIGGFMR